MRFYTESSFDPDNSIGYLVRRAHQMGVGALEPIFAAEGLTGTQWSALASIWFARGTTCAELARDLSHDKGATTRLIDTMEHRGLVTRLRDTGDRRVVNLALTDEGAAVAARCRLRVIDVWNEWLEDWSAGEIETLIALLQKLRVTLDTKTLDTRTMAAPCG